MRRNARGVKQCQVLQSIQPIGDSIRSGAQKQQRRFIRGFSRESGNQFFLDLRMNLSAVGPGRASGPVASRARRRRGHRISSRPASKAMKVCHALAAIPIVAANAQRKDLKISK
jgi:hypothetical protein